MVPSLYTQTPGSINACAARPAHGQALFRYHAPMEKPGAVPATPQADEQVQDWLLLIRTPGVGAITLARLLEHFGDPHTAVQAGDQAWRDAGLDAPARSWLAQPDQRRLELDLEWLAQPHHYLITPTSPLYPTRLTENTGGPPALFVVGDPEVLGTVQLAIVGSRNPTAGGRNSAREFAACLAQAGLVITSGLALGIDGEAHQGALDHGGLSIAVCGTGLDRVYPARHRELARALAEQGALVSEFPPGTPPHGSHFPQRNRIISGLSVGVLVVEAARRSGSLITARMALDQGREVFAMPGSIHNPLARGCHRLIREGAKLVETADDILEELAPLVGQSAPSSTQTRPSAAPASELDAQYQHLLDHMGFDPVRVDDIVERSALTPADVSSMLLLLELRGIVTHTSGGTYTRLK